MNLVKDYLTRKTAEKIVKKEFNVDILGMKGDVNFVLEDSVSSSRVCLHEYGVRYFARDRAKGKNGEVRLNNDGTIEKIFDGDLRKQFSAELVNALIDGASYNLVYPEEVMKEIKLMANRVAVMEEGLAKMKLEHISNRLAEMSTSRER